MLSLKVLSREQEPVFARRLETCRRCFRVEGDVQLGLAEKMVMATLQLDACRQEERGYRSRGSSSPVLSPGDLKRRLSVERKAAGLPADPTRVVRELRRSLQGCEWLLKRWQKLGRSQRAPDTNRQRPPEPLSDEARRQALDLLGVGLEQREGPTPLDAPGGPDAVAEHQAALIAAQVIDLEQAIAALVEKNLRRIARYEADARRLFRKSLKALRAAQATATAGVDDLLPEGLESGWGLIS
jgi:hypothetical protein